MKEFSVGVGPKIVGFTRGGTSKTQGGDNNVNVDVDNNDNEEEEEGIEFNLRAIPLGGYVRFPENYNATFEYEMEVMADQKRKEIQDTIDANREAAAAAAGEAGTRSGNSNGFGLLASVSSVLNLNKKAREEERMLALETMAVNLNKEENKNNNKNNNAWWNPFGKKSASDNDTNSNSNTNSKSIIIEEDGTVSVPPVDYYQDKDLLQNRPPLQRAIVLVGGVVFNIILAFTLYFGELTVGGGLQKANFGTGAVVSSSPRVNSASVGLLEKGDVILSFNGT